MLKTNFRFTFVSKPILPKELLRKVREVLDKDSGKPAADSEQ